MGTDRIASGKCIGGDQRGWHTVYLSAGSNLGERQQFLRAAVRLLQECSEIRNLKVSKLMETAPYGYTEQPAF